MAGIEWRGKCPRCGRETERLYIKATKSNTYYTALHKDGTMCYLGPAKYKYATRTNKVVIRGSIDIERELTYIAEAAQEIARKALNGQLKIGHEALKTIEEAAEKALASTRKSISHMY